jgi:hypothetical protein
MINQGLLPSAADEWATPQELHEHVITGAESINFIRGRLSFSEKGSAPFPSVLVVFDRKSLVIKTLCQGKKWSRQNS